MQKKWSKKINGIWKGVEIDSGYATLKIDEEKNTFSYISGGNGMGTFSNGHFEVTGDSILLTSTNATEIEGCYFILPFGQCSFTESRLTKLNCKPAKTKFYNFFDNDIFYIKDQFLIYKPSSRNNCPNQSLERFIK